MPVVSLSQKKLEANAKTVIAAANALSYELERSVTWEASGAGFDLASMSDVVRDEACAVGLASVGSRAATVGDGRKRTSRR